MNKKRIVSLLLSFALILGLMPVLSQTAYADTTSYQLWVGGEEVTSEKHFGTGWSYDAATNTLTLNNYSYSGDGYMYDNNSGADYRYAAIYAKQDLTIELEGENTAECTVTEGTYDDRHIGYGIHVNDENLTINGSGSLTVTGNRIGAGIYAYEGDITIASGTVTASGGVGIATDKAQGNVNINGGIVTANGEDRAFSGNQVNIGTGMGVNAGESKETAKYAINSTFETNHQQKWVQVSKAYPIWVGGTRVLTANAENITGAQSTTASYDESTKTLTLKGAEITRAYQYDTTHDASVYSLGSDLKIVLEGENNIGSDGVYNGILVAKDNSSGGNLLIEGSGTLNAKGKLNAISADGNLNIVGGTVDALVTSDNGANAIHAGGSVTIADGKVTADANGSVGNAIDAFDAVYINGGTVNAIAKGNRACAVYGYKKVEINDGTVTATANGAEGRAICSDDGNVIIEDGTISAAATGNEGCAIFGEDGGVSLTGGKITTTSSYNETDTASIYGIYAQKTGITIGKKTNLISAGTTAALHCENDGKVKNTIAGSGWTDYEGTKGKRYISVNDDPGQTLEGYKKVQFPAVPDGVVIDAQQVINKIKALPDPDKVTLNDEAKINEAREAYDKLSAEDKAKVSNDTLKKLTDAEAKLKELKKSAEDQETASKVSGMIAAIPDDPSKATNDQVSGAVEAFNSLTPDQKALITDGEVAKLQKTLNYPAKMMKAKLKSITAKKGRKAVAKWGERSSANGYQLFYKAKGVKAKKININSANTVKKTVKKLKAGKTYSFKVRTFTKVQNLADPDRPIKVYGKWSKAKKVKTKK